MQRAGDTSCRYGPLLHVAWFRDNSGGTTHPPGEKHPNAFGLHDTLGNVWEWVQDWYGITYYSHRPESDPKGQRAESIALRAAAPGAESSGARHVSLLVTS